MLCVLAFVGYGHIFVSGLGSVLYKHCHYSCGQSYRVSPYYECPEIVGDT